MVKTKLIDGYPFIQYVQQGLPPAAMLRQSHEFFTVMNNRRSIRDFSSRPVPVEVICNLIRTASTAPSGAHKQPWTFCVVSDPGLKTQIRKEAEKEEFESYNGRMPEEWLKDLRPLQTSWEKAFLETAPFLIVVFKKSYELHADGSKSNVYYAAESCGLACGLLLAAIHQAGLAALTHTPSPMNFLSAVLKRPENEKPFLLIPVGYPADECWVPDLERKNLTEISAFY
jgi:iodotyrosine deiodinase